MEPIAAVTSGEVRPIEFPAPAKPLSPPIVALEKVAVGYEPGNPVLRRLSLRIDPDDRIALLGPNGNGKSTLAKLLAGRLAPDSGIVTRAERMDVAYFAQHQLDELVPEQSVYQHVRRLMPDAPEARVRARAGNIGFSGERADTPVENLSGGEKARLLLGLATFAGPHLVILDEPTNHLDIDSRAALVEAINEFPGAAILISHDRYLIEACADRLWLVGDGTVAPYEGDLDDYRRLVLGREAKREERDDANKVSRTDQRRAAAEKREELKPLKRRIDAAEKTVARLTADIAAIDRDLADGLFARDPARATTLSKARADAADALAKAEEDWLTASAAYEDAMA
jgi:ATP-binding cassette subfamily F protein 3